jgi:hypothetical protein
MAMGNSFSDRVTARVWPLDGDRIAGGGVPRGPRLDGRNVASGGGRCQRFFATMAFDLTPLAC